MTTGRGIIWDGLEDELRRWCFTNVCARRRRTCRAEKMRSHTGSYVSSSSALTNSLSIYTGIRCVEYEVRNTHQLEA